MARIPTILDDHEQVHCFNPPPQNRKFIYAFHLYTFNLVRPVFELFDDLLCNGRPVGLSLISYLGGADCSWPRTLTQHAFSRGI